MCVRCDRATVVGTDLRRMGREVGRLERQLSPLTKEYHAILRGHPRCAACGLLVGEDHAEQQLISEPVRPKAKGQKRYDVCASCFDRLFRAHRSVPEQRALDRTVAEDLRLLQDDGEGDVDG